MALVSVVLVGLTVVAQTFGWLFFVLKYAGAVYLVVLGYRMWRAAGKSAGAVPSPERGLSRQFVVGAAVAFGNPKALLFPCQPDASAARHPSPAAARLMPSSWRSC